VKKTAARGKKSSRPMQSRKMAEVVANKNNKNGNVHNNKTLSEARQPEPKWPTATARRPPLPRKPTWMQPKESAGRPKLRLYTVNG
jgi:hypothetical protein